MVLVDFLTLGSIEKAKLLVQKGMACDDVRALVRLKSYRLVYII